MTSIEERLAALEAKYERTAAIQDIQSVTYDYFTRLAAGDADNLYTYFSHDGAFENAHSVYQGEEKLRQFFKNCTEWHTGAESLLLVEPVIKLDEKDPCRATGYWSLYFIHSYYLTSQPLFISHFKYENTYVKCGDEWKFKRIRLVKGFGPPSPPPYPGCHGEKIVTEVLSDSAFRAKYSAGK